jgi:ferritin-like metal-binding protein YciE
MEIGMSHFFLSLYNHYIMEKKIMKLLKQTKNNAQLTQRLWKEYKI